MEGIYLKSFYEIVRGSGMLQLKNLVALGVKIKKSEAGSWIFDWFKLIKNIISDSSLIGENRLSLISLALYKWSG